MSTFSKTIESLDLTNVMARLKKESTLTSDQLIEAELQYRQFLQISLEDTGTVPTVLADKVWHMHILDTRKYAADCQEIFGRFMHHTPHLEMSPEFTAAAQHSQMVLNDTFGTTAPSAHCSR